MKDGRQFFSEEGEYENVKVPAKADFILRSREDRSVIFIHNHPSGNSFSDMDLFHFFNDEAYQMSFVVGNNGTIHWMKKSYVVEYKVWTIMKEWAFAFMPLYRKFEKMVEAGEISEEEASLIHLHEILVELSSSFGFEYGRVQAGQGPAVIKG